CAKKFLRSLFQEKKKLSFSKIKKNCYFEKVINRNNGIIKISIKSEGMFPAPSVRLGGCSTCWHRGKGQKPA
ncbi:MAG: hypothetical protein ABF436_06775, partial [Acetobacter okinawensis]|uniref:hypothetical protein n=1 Tax=Acetobacter okinawensis TaxID=1076594 RepID=UPI0039E8C35C